MLSFEQKGLSVESFRKAVQKLDKEYRKQVAVTWRKHLKEAAAFGKSLISGLFGGRGRRIARAFRYSVSTARGDVLGRVGYRPSRDKKSFWWIGRIYESGGTIRNRSSSGRLFSGGERISGASRQGRAMSRAGVQGSRKLWVPIGANRGGDGSAVVSPSQFFSEFRGRSVVRTSQAGNLIAFAAQDGDLTPMFVLKDQIPIPQRQAATPTARRYFPIIADATGEAIYSNFRGLS